MTPLAVKNMSKAYEILEDKMGKDIKTYNTDARCECGITTRLRGIKVGEDNKVVEAWNVKICSSCGDDDNFVDELLYQ
jgi:hypothetical protein